MDILILICLLSRLSFCLSTNENPKNNGNSCKGNADGNKHCTTTKTTNATPASTRTTASTTTTITSSTTNTPTYPLTSTTVTGSSVASTNEATPGATSTNSSIDVIDNSTSTTPQPSTSWTVSTTTNMSTTASNSSSLLPVAQRSNEGVGVFVGAPLGILVCLCMTGVIIFLLRKRRMKKSKEKDDIIPTQVNVIYSEIDEEYGHDNPVFDKHAHIENGIPTKNGDSPAYHDETTAGIYDSLQDGEDEHQYVHVAGNSNFILEKPSRTADQKGNNKTENVDQHRINPSIAPDSSVGDAKGVYDLAQDIEDDPHRIQPTANAYLILEKVDGQSAGYNGQGIITSVDSNQAHFGMEQNVYNTANYDIKDGEYDHIGQIKKPQHVFEKGHYDLTFGGSRDNNEYDTTTGVKQENGLADGMFAHTKVNNDDI